MNDWNLFYSIKLAKRYRNAKRSYLLVNSLQAKHVPVRPAQAFDMFNRLGRQIREEYPNAKLILGFAETATAIALAVMHTMGEDCTCLCTTREALDGTCIIFEEEHSHAVEQTLYMTDFAELLKKTEEVVLIDDEISTGRTLKNMICALRKNVLELSQHKIVIGSNRVSAAQERRFQADNIYFESLFRWDFADTWLEQDLTQTEPLIELDFDSSFEVPSIRHMVYPNARKPVTSAAYYEACLAIANFVMEQIDCGRYHRILVLGTEECMYPSLFTAAEIEKRYAHVNCFCHATTRSPICVSHEIGYPIQNGYCIRSFYESTRVNYIYSLAHYDAALVLSDALMPSSIALGMLDRVLQSYDIQNRFYIFGE